MQSEIAVQENIDPRNVKANQQAREAEAMGPHGQQRMASVQRHNLDPRNLHASQQAKLAANHKHNGSKKEKDEIQKKREEFVQRGTMTLPAPLPPPPCSEQEVREKK